MDGVCPEFSWSGNVLSGPAAERDRVAGRRNAKPARGRLGVPNDTVSTAARRKLFRARRTRPSKVAARRRVRTSPGSSRDVVDAGTVPRPADAACAEAAPNAALE